MTWQLRRMAAAAALAVAGAAVPLALSLSGAAAAAADPWPQPRYDAGNSADNSAETAITAANVSQLQPVWAGPGQINGTPTNAGGAVITVCSPSLCAFDETTGALRWKTTPTSPPSLVPAIGDGIAVTTTDDPATVLAVDPVNGATVWSTSLPNASEAFSVGIAADGTVVTTDDAADVTALDPHTGAIRWSFHQDSDGVAAISGTTVFVASPAHLDALDLASGSQVWEGTVHLDVVPAVAASPTGVVVTGRSGGTGWPNVYLFPAGGCGASTCAATWSYDTNSAATDWVSPAAVTPTAVYAVDGAGSLYALDASRGTVQWTARVDSDVTPSPPAVAGDVVYVHDAGRVLAYAANGCGAASCTSLWSSQVAGPSAHYYTSPAVADGTLLSYGTDGVYAFRLPTAGQAAPSPPTPPTQLVATERQGGDIADVSWSKPCSGSFSITAYLLTTADGSHATWVDGSSEEPTGTISGLDPATTYQFSVTAFSAVGPSATSAASNAVGGAAGPGDTTTTAPPPQQCPAPTPIDTTAPVVHLQTAPAAVTLGGHAVVRFTATDSGSGLASYDIRWRAASWNGSWGLWHTTAVTTRTSESVAMQPGHDYCLAVRARDAAANVSGWTQRCTMAPLDDRALHLVAGWTRRTASADYLHTYTSASSRARGLSTPQRANTSRLALVATTCPTCGRVAIYLGESLLTTIDLHSSTWRHKRVFLLHAFARRHATVSIRPLSAQRPVLVDALAIGLA